MASTYKLKWVDTQEAKDPGPGNEEAGLFPREKSLTGPGLAGAVNHGAPGKSRGGGGREAPLATPTGVFLALGKGCCLHLPSWKATRK